MKTLHNQTVKTVVGPDGWRWLEHDKTAYVNFWDVERSMARECRAGVMLIVCALIVGFGVGFWLAGVFA